MDTSELAELGYDTDGLTPGADYVLDPAATDEGISIDLVYRAFLQLDQLNAMGGVSVLGGSRARLDAIHVALEDGVDLVTAVEDFGDEGQKWRARQLMGAGRVSSNS